MAKPRDRLKQEVMVSVCCNLLTHFLNLFRSSSQSLPRARAQQG